MISKLLILMPSPWAQLQSVKGKDFKICSCSLVGGAQSLPDLISAFPLMVSPCSIQPKDQMSSSTNNVLHDLSDNCSCVQVTHCSCSKPWYQVQLSLQLYYLVEGRTYWNGICVRSMNKGTVLFLKASQALSTGYSTLLKHWILIPNLLSSQWKKNAFVGRRLCLLY